MTENGSLLLCWQDSHVSVGLDLSKMNRVLIQVCANFCSEAVTCWECQCIIVTVIMYLALQIFLFQRQVQYFWIDLCELVQQFVGEEHLSELPLLHEFLMCLKYPLNSVRCCFCLCVQEDSVGTSCTIFHLLCIVRRTWRLHQDYATLWDHLPPTAHHVVY